MSEHDNGGPALKPCLFCGSNALEEQFGDESAYIRCRHCGAQSGRAWYDDGTGSFLDTEAEARIAWNRRTPEDSSNA